MRFLRFLGGWRQAAADDAVGSESAVERGAAANDRQGGDERGFYGQIFRTAEEIFGSAESDERTESRMGTLSGVERSAEQ